MKYEEIKYYIDLSISEFSSIKTVVFTGGECTLLGIRTLAKCINYASSKGLAQELFQMNIGEILYLMLRKS